MGDTPPRFSIVVPYRARLANIRLVFESLAAQTVGPGRFEVVVGVMEYEPEYVRLCAEFEGRLDIVSVLSGRPWQVGYARNLALRQARGEVLVLLDADMVLPPNLLRTLWDRHFAYGQRVCVVGQMIDYDNNTSDVETVEVKPFEHYRTLLARLEASGEVRSDPRVHAVHVIPWSFAWTALLAVPAAVVREHGLTFDLDFHGYGVEDLEWAHRLGSTGTPIVMGVDVYGIHLPHVRSLAANQRTESANYRRFLRKWPGVDVELACSFGDFEANERFGGLQERIGDAVGVPGGSLAVAKGEVDGVGTMVVGVVRDATGRVVDPLLEAWIEGFEILPLVGLALPWDDGDVARARVLEPVLRLGEPYSDRVLAEVGRVARSVVGPDRVHRDG